MENDRDPDEEIAARARLAVVAPSLPVANWSRAQWLPSDSNDVWRLDDVVLRVCWRGDRRRLQREALIAAALPASLLHPPMLGAGAGEGMTWQRMRNVAGDVLVDAWLDMETSCLRGIVSQLAEMLRTLHAWSPPQTVVQALAERERMPADPVGFNLLPLPVERAVALLEPASRLPNVDADLLRAVERRLDALSGLDPFASGESRAVVHGDAQLTNIIVNGDCVVALLDYEWCRMAPIDAELAIWLHVLRVVQLLMPGRDLPPLLRWLREDYPELFAHPDLEGRLWLYALTFALHGLLIWPPDAPEADLVAVHHLHALRALAAAPPDLPF